MTSGLSSQGGLIVLGEVIPEALASQGGLTSLGTVQPESKLSQAHMTGLVAVQPVTHLSQGGFIVLASARDCVTKECQLWRCLRSDGQEFFFTSHDVDVQWGEDLYLACPSLAASASEQTADQGDVGNIELSGIIDPAGITEEDLYGGLFDDAFWEVWRVSWAAEDSPRRIAAGWMGDTSHGEKGFKGEVLGPGARLLQKPLLATVAPACRWVFGDPDTCAFDAEAIRLIGGNVVEQPINRSFFYMDLADPGGAAQWNRGRVRWVYGVNAGQINEVLSVDFATGAVIFANPPAFLPEVGDSFDLLPGCDLSNTQCKAYDNFYRFGGFDSVPGGDQISKVPDAKA